MPPQKSSSSSSSTRPKPRAAAAAATATSSSSPSKGNGKQKASSYVDNQVESESDQDDYDDQEEEEQEDESDQEEDATPSSNNNRLKSKSKPHFNPNISRLASPTQSESESDRDQDLDLSSSEDDDSDDSDESNPKGNSKGNKRKLKMPSETQRLKKWRRMTVEERDNLIGEGGIVWETARSILLKNPLKPSQAQDLKSTLFKTLSKLDSVLEKCLIPPTSGIVGGGAVSIPLTSTSSTTTSSEVGVAGERGLNGAMRSWRSNSSLEEDGEPGEHEYHGDVAHLESLLLPEASQALVLSRALETQETLLENHKKADEVLTLKQNKEKERGNGRKEVELKKGFFL